MSGIKIKTTDKNMHKPAIQDLADGSLFIYLDTIYMKITIYDGDRWALNMETGKILTVPPNCEVEVVELHCEVVKANPYHHCKKKKVGRVEEMEDGGSNKPHIRFASGGFVHPAEEDKIAVPLSAEKIVMTEIKPMEVEEEPPSKKRKAKRPFSPCRGYQPNVTEEIEPAPAPPPKEE